MSQLKHIRIKAIEASAAARALEAALNELARRQCSRLGIDPTARTLVHCLSEGAGKTNLGAVRAWLDQQQGDWCVASDFVDEAEIESRLESAIRRALPAYAQGD